MVFKCLQLHVAQLKTVPVFCQTQWGLTSDASYVCFAFLSITGKQTHPFLVCEIHLGGYHHNWKTYTGCYFCLVVMMENPLVNLDTIE